MEILTAGQMRQIDRRTVRAYGVPEIVLMENAGLRLLAFLRARYPRLAARRIVLLCGRGNNGGDTFVLARHLRNAGLPFQAVLLGTRGDLRGGAAVNFSAAAKAGMDCLEVRRSADWARAKRLLQRADLIVDGVLGTGLSRPVSGPLAALFAAVNRSAAEVVAVDIPSGLSGDTTEIPGPSLKATHTVTFARPKLPHIFPPASSRCGTVHVADISIPAAAVAEERGTINLLEAREVAELLPARSPESHKGDFGHLLVVAGSRGKGGAARMAILAALRSGCGLVTAAVPASLQGALLAPAMEAMTEGLPETPDGSLAYAALPRLLRLLRGKRALAIGPGLTTHPETKKLVRDLVRRAAIPVVLDADGLNAFAASGRLPSRTSMPMLLTPHPGEMARLTGLTIDAVQADRIGAARRFARRHRCLLVLKGHHTVIARPDGGTSVNPTGNAGMAKGGSGDLLTGILGGLLAQGLSPASAAPLGVYLHGLAGDLAAAKIGQTALMARDILAHFPQAARALREPASLPHPLEVCP